MGRRGNDTMVEEELHVQSHALSIHDNIDRQIFFYPHKVCVVLQTQQSCTVCACSRCGTTPITKIGLYILYATKTSLLKYQIAVPHPSTENTFSTSD